MTDKLVKRLRKPCGETIGHGERCEDEWLCTNCGQKKKAADRIEAQAAEIERLRAALREVFEQWVGSEGFIPETAPEGYLLHLTKRMADIARAALAGKAKQ